MVVVEPLVLVAFRSSPRSGTSFSRAMKRFWGSVGKVLTKTFKRI